MQKTSVLTLAQQITILSLKLRKLEVITTNISLFFLGLTGSGKSSIISYCLGAQIQYVKQGLIYALSHKQNDKYPIIGNTNGSCTDIPSLYTHEGNTYYDPPGFLDTKGVQQEILNSYSNAKMFKRGNKAKIVLVVEFSTLQSGRGGDLPKVAKRLRQLFREDFKQIIQSCVLVITKVRSDEDSFEDILTTIQGIVNSNKNLIPECEMLLKTIIINKRVAIFPLPKFINQTVISNIKKSINAVIPFVIQNDAYVSLSPEAEIQIQMLSHTLGRDINNAAETLSAKIRQKFTREDQIKSEIEANLLKMKSAKDMLISNQLSNGNSDALSKFSQLVGLNQQEISQVKSLFDQMEFCKTLHQKVKTVNSIEEILMISVAECSGKLNTMFQKLASKEEIQNMNKKYEEERHKKQGEFIAERKALAEAAEKRQKAIRDDIKDQQKDFQNMMMQANKDHQESMNKLNAQLIQLASRPPQIIEKDSGFCEIM